GVSKIPLVHYDSSREDVEWQYYPGAGQRRAISELFVIDIDSKRPVRLDRGEEPAHLPLFWRSDGSEFLFLRVARYGKKLELVAADAADGGTRKILSETTETFLNFPFHQPREMLSALRDGKRFLWLFERDGWHHLYLYDFEGKLLRRLTKAPFPVVRIVDVDEEKGWVYFLAQGDLGRPYDVHLYRVGLEGGEMQQLTDAPGRHDVRLSPSKDFFLDAHSSVERPPSTDLRSADGSLLRTLAATDTAPLGELRWRPPEEVVVKAADGETDLWGVVYTPHDFDPGVCYPVVQLFEGDYGGATGFPSGFADVRGQALAQLGFVVVRIATRGSAGRGKEFRDFAYGQPGRHETADQVAALRQLAASRPFMDLGRVGAFGGSYPGFKALRALLAAPDVYHAAVLVAPITDMSRHWRNEPILGPPDQRIYSESSNPALAANLKAKLLLIHGTSDRDVPIFHTMEMIAALIRGDKPFDLLVVPGQDHGSWNRYLSDRAIPEYFVEHLRPHAPVRCQGRRGEKRLTRSSGGERLLRIGEILEDAQNAVVDLQFASKFREGEPQP
ncbi:MAG TPA: DPP IV N-terminal domain-containing protein, partial [Thermoanaerobaculia bacterium]|nr:DPP IV N-terminal domain-containing protein [Thermoanaerobaculia bacterium]